MIFSTSLNSLTFPGGKIIDIEIASTAGNVQTSITPGSGKTYILQAVRIECNTDGTAVNRYPNCFLNNAAGSRIWSSYYVGPVTASQSGISVGFYTDTAPLLTANAIMDNFNVPVPRNLIKDDDDFRINMGGQAGDDYDGVIRFRSFEI